MKYDSQSYYVKGVTVWDTVLILVSWVCIIIDGISVNGSITTGKFRIRLGTKDFKLKLNTLHLF